MQVAKWGNSLAVRLPAELVRAMNLREGDAVDLEQVAPGKIGISRDEARAAAWAELDRLVAATSFPVDYRFDREEANAR